MVISKSIFSILEPSSLHCEGGKLSNERNGAIKILVVLAAAASGLKMKWKKKHRFFKKHYIPLLHAYSLQFQA